jgi:TOMM system kinase/cyclase fusion protein
MQHSGAVLAPGIIFDGRYEIVSKLGEGGFGIVHKARQLSTGQPVALKVLRASEGGGAASDTRVARFLREARLCAQLHHPNIVQLVDSGQTADGTLYIVFTFVPGNDLAGLLATEGTLAPREARDLMLQVLDALACAHAAGVVHRDLKPSNIMVIPTGARRNALVLDFGIGAILDDERSARLTGSNDGLGTPGYGAPEQWGGGATSPRADLFSWGLVFLECLTGTRVYNGSPGDVFYRLLGPDPVPIPAAIERHALGALIARAVRKDAAARDVTARGLFEALDACDVRGLSREKLRAAGESPGRTDTDTLATLVRTPLAEGERRYVTAIACVLGRTGTRRAGARADDGEDAQLRAGLMVSADIARHHGGHVAAMFGDELLVYFGYGRAEEDDARRAARTAFGILAALEANEHGLRAQIGIHAGLVVAYDDDHPAVAAGSTARLVSRLARISAPGRVLVTADAHKLLRGWFALHAGGVPVIEEAGAALKVFHLRSLEQVTGATPQTAQAPLTGREHEIELLMDRWRRTRGGEGQSSLLIGEPGIGKSRLLRELHTRLTNEAHTFLEARCVPDTRNNALFAMVELVSRALGLDTEASPADKVARLEAEITRHGLAPAETMPLFSSLLSLPLGGAWPPLDVSPPKQKELTLNAILALLFALAEEQPVLLMVEDLHWADPTTLELLGQLVREAPSARMCVLLTARPEFSPTFPTTAVLQLHLNRLERAEIEAMVGALMGHKALPAAVLEQVVRRTDGVPLFVEELIWMIAESGALVEREGCYELSGSLSEVEIPSTLRGLLTARLDRLGQAKETAQLAAALGREFSVELLAAVSTLGAAGVQQDLDRLVGAGLVLWKRRAKDLGAVFRHALVRDAAYESLATGARQKVHTRIAATLEAQFHGIVEARPDLLAYHHAAAEQQRVAIGYAQKAARAALMRSANTEAIAHGRQALGWLDEIEDRRERAMTELKLNEIITPALMATKGYGAVEVEAAVERSQSLLDELGDGPSAFPTLWALWGHHELRGNHAIAKDLGRRSLALAERAQERGLQIVASIQVGHNMYFDGQWEQARAYLERARALYDPVAHREHAFVFGQDSAVHAGSLLGHVLWFLGYPDLSEACLRDAVQRARALGHANSIGLALYYLASLFQFRRAPQVVREVTGELLELAARHDLQVWMVCGTMFRAWAEHDAEQPRQIVEALVSMGAGQVLPYFMSLSAEGDAEHGNLDAAIARLDDCLRIAAAKQEPYYVPELYRLKGACLQKRGGREDDDDAATLFSQAMALARSQGARMPELRATLSLYRCRPSFPGIQASLAHLAAGFPDGLDIPEITEARLASRRS